MFMHFSEVVVSFLETRDGFFFFPFLATTAGNKLTLSKNCHLSLGKGAGEGAMLAKPQAQIRACTPGCPGFSGGRWPGEVGGGPEPVGPGVGSPTRTQRTDRRTVERSLCMGLSFDTVPVFSFLLRDVLGLITRTSDYFLIIRYCV